MADIDQVRYILHSNRSPLTWSGVVWDDLVFFFFFAASESSLKNVELPDIESLGTKVAVRYGVQLKLLQSTTDGVEDLTYLLKYCKFFLQGQQRTTDVTLRILVKYAQI